MFSHKFSGLIIGLFFLAGLELSATGFDLGTTSGSRNFELNTSVSAPEVQFVSKAPLEDIKGTVNASEVSSQVSLDPNNIESASGTVSFKVTGMETGIKRRDGHLAGKDWLDAESYPDITFKLQKLANVKINADKSKGRSVAKADAVGTISIHGKTKNITVPVTITYISESEATKKRAPGDLLSVEGNMDVALKDFDVSGTKGLVGSRVGEVINTSFKLFYSSKEKKS